MISTFFRSFFLVTLFFVGYFLSTNVYHHLIIITYQEARRRKRINTKYFSIFCQAIKLQPSFTTKNNTIYTIQENRFLSNKNEIKYKCTCFVFSLHSRFYKCEKSNLLFSVGNTVLPFMCSYYVVIVIGSCILNGKIPWLSLN